MGRKIFVSYKYADNDVENILGSGYWGYCTARHYVDEIERMLGDTDDIYKGESDGEDLSYLAEETLWEKLKNRIYDSTVTVVLLSKGMKEPLKEEKNQWIPQEISYSLKEMPRKNKNGDSVTSHTNALLAVVIPDRDGNYSYFTENKACCTSGCRTLKKNSPYIFDIIRGNLFNQKVPDCKTCTSGDTIYYGRASYMLCVKWDDFKDNMSGYIDAACDIQSHKEDYDIRKTP